jgi:membrane-bound lytic murein transglycosylase A
VRLRGRALAAALAALTLGACATVQLRVPEGPASLARLPGWEAEDHAAAFQIARRACADMRATARGRVCAEALSHGALGEGAARAFLETHYRVEPIAGEGLLTAYFAPAYPARRSRNGEFSAAVRPAPREPAGAPDRARLSRAPAPDALAWMRPEDLFFMQVQGSGVLTFEDGSRRRAVFAATNGAPFVAIARPMVAERLIGAAHADAGSLHDWLAAHRGPEADAVMDKDPRYVFFRLVQDTGGEPQGSSGAVLIPGRSLAVDPAFHRYFELLWIDAGGGGLTGARPGYRRLTVAMDRGGAIKGPVRADLYTGHGPRAGEEAASVRHALRLYRIVPADGR